MAFASGGPLFWWEAASGASRPPQLFSAEVEAALPGTNASHLGSGAFGETWRLESVRHGDAVAMKVIMDPAYPPAVLAREVAGLRRVSSPRVVSLLGVETLNFLAGQRLALIFEEVVGSSLANVIARGQRPNSTEAKHLAVGLLEGLEAMHDVDTVHRDIKPANIMLRNDNWAEPVILDFGLAKLLDNESLTNYPAILGTPPYMAPEQIAQRPARKAADLWATAVTVRTTLDGVHPFYDDRAHAIDSADALLRISSGPRAGAAVDVEFDRVVARLLSAKPHERGSARRALADLS